MVAAGAIKSALITPDGRDVIAVTLRDLSPLASSHTVIVQFAELQAGTGRLIRVLRTQTARLDQDAFISLQNTLGVLSFESAGQYVLVQGIQFGWLEVGGPDPGRFTPLPLPPAPRSSCLRPGRPAGHSPVAPSMRSRSRSACPRWRAYSSIMCR